MLIAFKYFQLDMTDHFWFKLKIPWTGCSWEMTNKLSAKEQRGGMQTLVECCGYHCSFTPPRPSVSDSDFGQNWSQGRIPYSFWMIPRGLLGTRITGNRHTTQPLINHLSCTGEHVIRNNQDSNPGSLSWAERPNHFTTVLHSATQKAHFYYTL
jgi:hypothetical protein